MAHDARKAQILHAAQRVRARDGTDRFSLEQVAREAGVALRLPRHYFQSSDGLLAAALIDAAHEITDVLIAPAPTLPWRTVGAPTSGTWPTTRGATNSG